MIQIKVAQIVGGAESIRNILAAKLPVKTAYQLARIGKALGKELDAYNMARNKLITDLGEADEQGNIQVTNGNLPEFAKQMNELLAMEIKIEAEPVKVEALGDKCEVSAADLMACDLWIVE